MNNTILVSVSLMVLAPAFLTAGFARAMAAASEDIGFDNVSRDAWTGEPYELLGKRMVFTSWYLIRPGSYAWVDDEGRTVTASSQAKIGPEGAHFVRGDDMAFGVRLEAERPERRGPIVQREQPWETMGLSLSFILQEGERYRAWGRCQDAGGHTHFCYLESSDGLNWTRPKLDLVEYEGSTANNLIPYCPDVIFIDPTAPAESRYKGVDGGDIGMSEFRGFIEAHPDRWEHRALRKDAGFIAAIFGYTSADGIRWKRLEEPFTVEHSDTQQGAYYDPQRKKYVLLTRTYFVGPRSVHAPEDPRGMSWLGDARGAGRRSIGYTESDHFGDFPVSQLILTPRSDMAPTELLYTNGYTAIPKAPDHHLLFPTIWDTSTDATRLEAAASHDGRVWNWIPGGSLMETPNFGEFDGGCVFWHPNLIELPTGEFALPYTGYAFPHKYPRGAWSYAPGYAIWPHGRLAAVVADEKGGFTTVSVMPPGHRLSINAVTERAGSIRVAVTYPNGTYVEGRSPEDAEPIVGDQAWTPVRWQAADGLGVGDGQPICLRFELDCARLYGVQFED